MNATKSLFLAILGFASVSVIVWLWLSTLPLDEEPQLFVKPVSFAAVDSNHNGILAQIPTGARKVPFTLIGIIAASLCAICVNNCRKRNRKKKRKLSAEVEPEEPVRRPVIDCLPQEEANIPSVEVEYVKNTKELDEMRKFGVPTDLGRGNKEVEVLLKRQKGKHGIGFQLDPPV